MICSTRSHYLKTTSTIAIKCIWPTSMTEIFLQTSMICMISVPSKTNGNQSKELTRVCGIMTQSARKMSCVTNSSWMADSTMLVQIRNIKIRNCISRQEISWCSTKVSTWRRTMKLEQVSFDSLSTLMSQTFNSLR